MSFYPENRTVMSSEAASQSAMSEVNPHQDFARCSLPQGLSDGFSLDDVFAAMMKDLHDLFEEVSARETEFNHISKQGNLRRSQSYLSYHFKEYSEYMETLNKKGDIVEKITATIENMNLSPDIPKAKIHCYQKYAALLKKRYELIRQDVDMMMEDVRKSKQEYERMEKQVETFKTLKEDEESTNEGLEVMQLFKEAKTDLNTVLSALYPDNIKEEFSNAMAELTEAYMKNDNEEDQYVELSPETLQNSAIICLIKDHVIVEDPANPTRYRLNMAE